MNERFKAKYAVRVVRAAGLALMLSLSSRFIFASAQDSSYNWEYGYAPATFCSLSDWSEAIGGNRIGGKSFPPSITCTGSCAYVQIRKAFDNYCTATGAYCATEASCYDAGPTGRCVDFFEYRICTSWAGATYFESLASSNPYCPGTLSGTGFDDLTVGTSCWKRNINYVPAPAPPPNPPPRHRFLTRFRPRAGPAL